MRTDVTRTLPRWRTTAGSANVGRSRSRLANFPMAAAGRHRLAYTQREERAMQLDLRLPHSFEVEWLREMPAGQPAHYYPASPAAGSDDGLLLRFQPNQGAAWIGSFAFGTGAPNAPS